MGKGVYSNFKPGLKGLIFLFLIILGLLETGLITVIVFKAFHISFSIFKEIDRSSNAEVSLAIRISSLIQNIFLFFVPSIFLAYLCDDPNERGLLNPKAVNPLAYLIILLLWISINPFITRMGLWNEKIVLPKALSNLEQWIKNSEDKTDSLIEAMLKYKSWSNTVLNLVFMALVPAIGEEWFFRGGVQKTLLRLIPSKNAAIWIGAIFFSAIHFQFYGFFPRLLLGLILGYLFFWSGSIWPGVLFHFINNGLQIILFYFSPGPSGKDFPDWMEKPGIFLVICSVILSGLLLRLLFNSFKRSEP